MELVTAVRGTYGLHAHLRAQLLKDGADGLVLALVAVDHRGGRHLLDQAHRLAVRIVHGLDDGVDVVEVVGQEVVLERRVHLDHVGDLPGQDGHDGAGQKLVLPVLEL